MIHRPRIARRFVLRSRNAYTPARTSVSLAERNILRRPPTNPLTFLRSRFLDWVRAAPFIERMADFPSLELSTYTNARPRRARTSWFSTTAFFLARFANGT